MLYTNTSVQASFDKSFNMTARVKMCSTATLFKTSLDRALHRPELLGAEHKRTQISPHLRSGHRCSWTNIFDKSSEAEWGNSFFTRIGCQSAKHLLLLHTVAQKILYILEMT